MKKLLILTFFAAVAAFWTACSKEETSNPNSTVQSEVSLYKFSKQIEIFDATGKNSATMEVSSNEQERLDAYSANNFNLIPLKEGQSIEDVEQAVSEVGSATTDSEIPPGLNSVSVSFKVLKSNLSIGFVSFGVEFKHPESDDRGFELFEHLGQAGIDKKVTVCRRSFWHRVWQTIEYKAYASSAYSTIISSNLLSNNECKSQQKDPCYLMRATIEARSQSHYTVTFQP
jgi:hypothetical protein